MLGGVHMDVYFCIANNLRFLKGFLNEQWAKDWIIQWNSNPANKDALCHLETYHVMQEPVKYNDSDACFTEIIKTSDSSIIITNAHIVVYFCVGNGLRFLKGFIYEQWAKDWIAKWNSDPANKDDLCHLEAYPVMQEPVEYWRS